MPNQQVIWKPIKTQEIRGADYYSFLPDILDTIYCGTLYTSILGMEKKKPISLAEAISWVTTEFFECYKDKRSIEAEWTLNNFVDWISTKGYHIELTGEEYEVTETNALGEKLVFRCLKQDGQNTGKHLIKWKAFKITDANGYPDDEQMPELIEKQYRGTLLTKILSMPAQNPISFEEAVKIAAKAADAAFSARKVGSHPGHYHWYINNFVDYIASLKFHIELTGEEFDRYEALDHVMFC